VKVLDNFLYKDLYAQLLGDLDDLDYRLIDTNKGAYKHEASLGDDLTEQIKSCYQKKVAEPVGFFDVSVVKCDPGYEYNIHADNPNKIVSTVVYLYPEQGDGTSFVKEERVNSIRFDEIIWKPNRLVSWVNKGQRHMYRNTTDEIRCTLNIYQKKRDSFFKVQSSYG